MKRIPKVWIMDKRESMSDFNITLFETCELLNRSKKSISRYIRRGLLHPERVKSQQGTLEYRFSKADIEAFKAQEALNAEEARQNSIDDFMKNQWIPKFMENFTKESGVIDELEKTSDVDEKNKILQEFGEEANKRIEERRTALKEDKPKVKETPGTLRKPGRPITNRRDITKSSQEGLPEGWTRACFIIKEEILEKLKDYAYTDRKKIKEVITEALENYLKSKKIIKRRRTALKEG